MCNSHECDVLHKTLDNQNCAKTPIIYVNSENAGMDNRYNESDVDYDLIWRLEINYEKYKTLKFLEDDRVSILDKLKKITDLDVNESGIIKPPNLKAGDLTKEWDFNI